MPTTGSTVNDGELLDTVSHIHGTMRLVAESKRERRGHFRGKARPGRRVEVRYRVIEHGQLSEEQRAYTKNIGIGGAFIITPDPAPPGHVAADRAAGAGVARPIEVRGDVRWIVDGKHDEPEGEHGMGVKFGGLDVEQLHGAQRILRVADVDHGPRRGLSATGSPTRGARLRGRRAHRRAVAHAHRAARRRPRRRARRRHRAGAPGGAAAGADDARPGAAQPRRLRACSSASASGAISTTCRSWSSRRSPTRPRSSAPTRSASSTSWPSRSTSICSTPSSRSS